MFEIYAYFHLLCIGYGYGNKSSMITLIPYLYGDQSTASRLGWRQAWRKRILDKNINRGLRANESHNSRQIKSFMLMVLKSYHGAIFHLPLHFLDDVYTRYKFTDRKLQCIPYAAEAQLRLFCPLNNFTWSMMISGRHSLRPGRIPDIFSNHIAIYDQML
jgi:hypothetical protein